MQSTLAESQLLLQKQKNGLDGELHTSGSICETFIKRLIKSHLPNHLRLTSGYILDPEKKHNNENLSQFDLIIADNKLPPIYKFTNIDIEVVPVESVCAVFELKRTITEKTVNTFIKKLSDDILKYKNLHKNMPFNLNTVNPANLGSVIDVPLVGLICLESDLRDQSKLDNEKNDNIVDFIWGIDGYIERPFKIVNPDTEEQQILFSDILHRPINASYPNITEKNWIEYLKINDGNKYKFVHGVILDKAQPEKICTTTVGWLRYMLFRLGGRGGIDCSKLINEYYCY